MVALLDSNVLLALAWENHIHHEAAHNWFAMQRSHGWATCLLTQAAFVRLSAQPAVVKVTVSVPEAIRLLEANVASAEHQFWPDELGVVHLPPEIRGKLMGHHQIADALLLHLAIRKGGKLATFDQRLKHLLPTGSPHVSALEILPVA